MHEKASFRLFLWIFVCVCLASLGWFLRLEGQRGRAAVSEMEASMRYNDLVQGLHLDVLYLLRDCRTAAPSVQLRRRNAAALNADIQDFSSKRSQASFLLSKDRNDLINDEKWDAAPARIERARNHLDADMATFGNYLNVDMKQVSSCDLSSLPQ